ncbi:MAG: aldehyde ferredoxin oxidoreductase family protein, partial [Candidatus Aminicenantes bacterium]|nr:aldehyde ferredoxin oxidoreductase family protein [Candidatus Aminicenantes bacterium]
MIKGIQNKYLHIDLSQKTVQTGTPKEHLFSEFLGGKGAGLKLMLDMGLTTQDSFQAENPIIFITGPFTGTPVQTSARSALVTMSPLTGTFLDSHVGGHFGPMIKRAGLDYIIITGRSTAPVYLHIRPSGVSFEDAKSLWGKGIFQAEKELKSKYPQARIASIGPAGENQVKFACIGTDYYRQFGRGGAGAVMGSKNLKAVVVEGNEKIEFFNRDKFMELNTKLTNDILAHPNRAKRFDLGTNMWIRLGQEEGHFLPTRNFQDVHFEDYENITSEAMKKKLNWKSVGCFNCIIQCAKMANWKNYQVEGPEYETTAYLGSGCGIGDAEAVAYANYLCDDLGLDTISAGVVTSFAMEAFEKGILSSSDCDGIELKFGNAEAQVSLLKKIANREGIGDLLAEGTRIASQKIGKASDYFAIQTAGMELSGVNIKGCASMGLTLATADFASHTRFWSASDEMAGLLTYENTPEFVRKGQDEVNARNSMIVCDFVPFGFDRLAPVYKSLTGIEVDGSRLMRIGEKISNLNRMVNIQNGRTRNHDTLPQRFFQEKHMAGIFKGKLLTEEIFSQWLDMYYQKRGWDNRGIPMDEKL